ncbi:MAG: carbohydrate ABC transporter permease, partial [Rhizobacter sp.]
MTATLAPDAQSLSSATPRGEAGAPLKQPAAPRRVSRFVPRMLMAPAVVSLLLWMIVPLVMTVWFSLIRYNLMQPGEHGFVGLENYTYFITDPDFWPSVSHTLQLLGSVIAITVVLGV